MKYFIYTRKSTESEDRQIMSLESQFSELKEFAAKEKLEIVLSAPVPAFTQEFRSGKQDEAGGRRVWGVFPPPPPASSVRIFSNRRRSQHFLSACSRLVAGVVAPECPMNKLKLKEQFKSLF